jgi:hypothetical protein
MRASRRLSQPSRFSPPAWRRRGSSQWASAPSTGRSSLLRRVPASAAASPPTPTPRTPCPPRRRWRAATAGRACARRTTAAAGRAAPPGRRARVAPGPRCLWRTTRPAPPSRPPCSGAMGASWWRWGGGSRPPWGSWTLKF